jgi:hypothetical protein
MYGVGGVGSLPPGSYPDPRRQAQPRVGSTRRRPADYGRPLPRDWQARAWENPTDIFQGDRVSGFEYQYVDPVLRANPVLEQPRLVFNSLGQPLSGMGFLRHVRTGMGVAFSQLGRWFFAGYQQGQFRDRTRISGVMSRGFTYSFTPATRSPGPGRTQRLGPPVGR